MHLNSEVIKRNRAQSGVNQKDFAKLAGITTATLSGIECGKSCTYETAKKIADALNLKLDDIIM